MEQGSVVDLILGMAMSLRRHWLRCLQLFVVLMALLMLVVLFAPRKYESRGKLFVRLGRGGLSMDATGSTAKTVMIQETRESEVNSVADVLGSRAMMENVVDDVGIDEIMESNFIFDGWFSLPSLPSFGEANKADSVGDSEMDYGEMQYRDKAIRDLTDCVSIKPTKKAATITIRVKASSPVLAQKICNSIMENYLNMHIEANQTNDSYAFFQNQLEIKQASFSEATGQLRDYRNKIKVTTIAGERSSLQQQLDRVESEKIGFEAKLAGATSRIRSLHRTNKDLDARVNSEDVAGNDNLAADRMRDRLFALEIAEKELATRFSRTHPKVKSIRGQLAETKKVMASIKGDRTTKKTEINPIKMDVEGTLVKAEADVEGFKATIAALDRKHENLLGKLESLHTHEAKLMLMQDELSIARINYQTYADKLEQARIDQELDRQQMSNVKVIQPASLMLKATAPKRLLMLVLGTFLATLASFVFAQLLTALDKTFQKPEDAANQLGLPVLVTIPRSQTNRPLV